MKKYSVKKRMELLIKIAQAAPSASVTPSSSMTPEQKSALAAYMSSGTVQTLSNDQFEKLKGIISSKIYDTEKKRRDDLNKKQEKPKPTPPAPNPAVTPFIAPRKPGGSVEVDATPW